jgi:multidrug efflux pump subunit AcrA (membrane-fusion protein)
LAALLAAEAGLAADEICLSDCIVSLKEQALVPARQAGVIASLAVTEGSRVATGDLIAQLDDSQRQLEQQLAQTEREEAALAAADDTGLRHAQAATLVAKAELDAAAQVNQRVPGTYPKMHMDRLRLTSQKSTLVVEQSQLEQKSASLVLRERQLALALAQQNVKHCRIASPVPGEVIEVLKHPGEWAGPGEPIVRVARLDVLRIEGFISAAEFDPAEVSGRPICATVNLARGRTAAFQGQIVYVSPIVQAGGQYVIHAEVANRAVDGHWLLRPGMIAALQIGAGAAAGGPAVTGTASVLPSRSKSR